MSLTTRDPLSCLLLGPTLTRNPLGVDTVRLIGVRDRPFDLLKLSSKIPEKEIYASYCYYKITLLQVVFLQNIFRLIVLNEKKIFGSVPVKYLISIQNSNFLPHTHPLLPEYQIVGPLLGEWVSDWVRHTSSPLSTIHPSPSWMSHLTHPFLPRRVPMNM